MIMFQEQVVLPPNTVKVLSISKLLHNVYPPPSFEKVQLPVKFALKTKEVVFYETRKLATRRDSAGSTCDIVDPSARQKATALINKWNHEVVVNPPSVSVNDNDS